MTQNRYYSNDGYAVQLTVAISSTDLQIQVASMTNWPTVGPFVLSIEPGTLNEELVLVGTPVGTGKAISPLNVTRGFDGTTPQPHAASVMVVPKICQLDLAEPQQHINQTHATDIINGSPAHGLPVNAWSGGQYQLIGAQNISTAQSSVTFNQASYFSLIPSGCTSVMVVSTCRSTFGSGNTDLMQVQLNGYTGSNYGCNYVQSGGPTNVVGHSPTTATSGVCGIIWGSAGAPGLAARNVLTFPFFNDSTWSKNYTFQSTAADGSSNTNTYSVTGGGVCSAITAPITSLTLFPATGATTFVAGSMFALYAY